MTFLLRTPFHSQLFWAIMWMSGFVKHRREWKVGKTSLGVEVGFDF